MFYAKKASMLCIDILIIIFNFDIFCLCTYTG